MDADGRRWWRNRLTRGCRTLKLPNKANFSRAGYGGGIPPAKPPSLLYFQDARKPALAQRKFGGKPLKGRGKMISGNGCD
jgi:hypothetical protein